jgi:predicted alpha/beta superfamily hydrolase
VLAAVEMHPDRERAYFPSGTHTKPEGQADIYTDLLAGRLTDQLRSRFRIAKEPLTIIGASNGAIHALLAGLARPDAFGGIGCLSYAVFQPERNVQRIESLSCVPHWKIYIDSGTCWAEGDREDDSDDNVLISYQLRDMLLRRGLILEGDLRYLLAYGDAHSELAWRRRIGGCLSFLLRPA